MDILISNSTWFEKKKQNVFSLPLKKVTKFCSSD